MQKYTLLKKSNSPSNIHLLQEIAVKEVMETITLTHNNLANRAEPSHETAEGEDLLSHFNQYSDLNITQLGMTNYSR